jgi:hypothetical protein
VLLPFATALADDPSTNRPIPIKKVEDRAWVSQVLAARIACIKAAAKYHLYSFQSVKLWSPIMVVVPWLVLPSASVKSWKMKLPILVLVPFIVAPLVEEKSWKRNLPMSVEVPEMFSPKLVLRS